MIRVLIVGERQQYCRRLKIELQKEATFTVVGCAPTLEQALHEAQYADVVLVDAASDPEKAVEMIQKITAEHDEVRVLATGVEEGAGEILTYLEAGAAGYVAQNDSREQLLQKMGAAGRNEAIVAPDVAAQLMSRFAELTNTQATLQGPSAAQMRHFDELTPREWEVLGLVAEGLSNQAIADQLCIACGTVKNHVHRILKKLSASNRHEAAAAYLWKLKREPSTKRSSRP